MGRVLLKDPKPLIEGFICPVTMKENDVPDTGCAAHTARFRGTYGNRHIRILGKFRCDCGKNLVCGVLVGGEEMTPQRYAADREEAERKYERRAAAILEEE